MKGILIATDGSAGGHEAVEYGLDLARSSHSSATVIYVRRAPRPLVGDPFYGRELSEELRRANDAVDHALRAAADKGVGADAEILEGDPATQIIEFARLRDADLIVVGSRNRGPLLAALLGSVSREVLTHADRPVLVAHGSADGRRAVATA
jgi:nucleotide-binding universal stress UspA family protein